MSVRYNKAPFPWFGGKQHAAPLLWALLGDPIHYVSAFAGALGDLLERPHPCNRTYYSETISDTDGLLVNAWRSIQWHPDATAEAASWPVSELDKQARQIALLKWQDEKVTELLAGSATWCDPQMAGWWLYAVCCHIGAFDGRAPWARVVDRQSFGKKDYTGKYLGQEKNGAGRNMLASVHAARAAGMPHDNPFPAPTTTGWIPTCPHPEAPVVPCTILDPFSGTGTTVLVAQRLGLHGIGIELSADYVAHTIERLTGDAPLLANIREGGTL